MKLFLANINEVTEEHLELISPERREQALRYRFSADRRRSIAAGLLLRRFLGGYEIVTDAFGKPRAVGGACFNLSHSGDWVLMALSDREVGCDIEQIKQVDPLRLGKVVFTENELAVIRESRDRIGCFFDFWTKKEALLKCMGKGFHRAAKSVEVCEDSFSEGEAEYSISTRRFADYTVSVCVCGGSAAFKTERIHF